ncbi:hypothetical protein V6N11_063780 [Hibiscus sabdariffa]|uniref:Uncharacterized protein n=1 Tax=Hibiscus sabdariffa TaxID=183260 RepID=A0ABR2PLP2_9ROSI
MSRKHLGVRSVDGMLEALPFRAWKSNREDQLVRVEWHTLNLKSGEISETLSTMPPEARPYGTAVACGNRVYVLGGLCFADPSCPDLNFNTIHYNNCVFYFDCARPDCEWERAPPMLVPRQCPSAVAIGGMIYVFGSTSSTGDCFAEVFNTHENRWDILPPPPVSSLDLLRLSDPVIFDPSRSRILVHFSSNHSLYAFSPAPDGGSWECLDTEFWSWSSASVIVDDVAYFLFDSADSRVSFGAYHIVDKRWLPRKVERLSNVIKILCSAAKKCMREKKMHMGPWRKQGYMQAKWLKSCERNTSTVNEKPRASMLTEDLLGKLSNARCTALEVV